MYGSLEKCLHSKYFKTIPSVRAWQRQQTCRYRHASILKRNDVNFKKPMSKLIGARYNPGCTQ